VPVRTNPAASEFVWQKAECGNSWDVDRLGSGFADGERATPESELVISSWVLVGSGAVLGAAVGIGVSLTTDLPLAPEIGRASVRRRPRRVEGGSQRSEVRSQRDAS